MFSRRALQGRLHWLLDLEAAGEIVRLAEHEMMVAVEKRTAVPYHAGLVWSHDFGQPFSAFSYSAQVLSADLTLHVWPHLDIPDLIRKGHVPGCWTARLMLYSEIDGEVVTVLQGGLRDPKCGGSKEPLVCTLTQEPYDDLGSVLPETARIDDTTFPAAGADYVGEWGQLVFGSPCGDLTELAPANRHPHGGSPVIVIHAAGVYAIAGMIAHHHTYAGLHGDSVTITNYTQAERRQLVAQHGTDARGQPMTYVVFDPTTVPAWDPDDSLWCAWRENDNGLSVPVQTWALLREDDTGEPLLGAGDLLLYLAKRSQGLPWNYARLDALRLRLNAYRLDGYIQPNPDETISPYAWIQEYLLRDLPLSAHTTDGVYLRTWDYAADVSDAVIEIRDTDDARNAHRITMVGTTSIDDVITDIDASFFFQHSDDKAKLVERITGDPNDLYLGQGTRQTGELTILSTFGAGGVFNTFQISDGTTTEQYQHTAAGGPTPETLATELYAEMTTAAGSANWTSVPAGPSTLVDVERAGSTLLFTGRKGQPYPRLTIQIDVAFLGTGQLETHNGDTAGVATEFRWDTGQLSKLNPWLMKSWLLYGDRKRLHIDLPLVEDRTTVGRILSARAAHGGPQRLTATYLVQQYPGGLVEPGSVVAITDDDMGWDRMPGIVVEAVWTDRLTREIHVEIPIHGYGQAG